LYRVHICERTAHVDERHPNLPDVGRAKRPDRRRKAYYTAIDRGRRAGPSPYPNLKRTLNKTPNFKQQKKRREDMQKKRNEEKQRQQAERKSSDLVHPKP
jgi:hypothetical protein